MDRLSDHEACAKCGSDDVAMEYQPAIPERRNMFPAFGGPAVYPAKPECIGLMCRRCQWTWDRLPKDAAASSSR